MDDGRLELDDDGAVVGSSHVVDLMDPAATEELHATKAQALVERHVSPWLGRHRRPVAAAVVAALTVGLGAAWWTHRPVYVAPPVPLTIENAVLFGRDIGGPVIRDDGYLLVAFAARATDPSVRFDVLDLVGPGLATTGVVVDRPATPSTDRRRSTARPGCRPRRSSSAPTPPCTARRPRTSACGCGVPTPTGCRS